MYSAHKTNKLAVNYHLFKIYCQLYIYTITPQSYIPTTQVECHSLQAPGHNLPCVLTQPLDSPDPLQLRPHQTLPALVEPAPLAEH